MTDKARAKAHLAASIAGEKTGTRYMIDSRMMRAGVMFLIVGMVWGIEMGVRQEFSLAPAHAHFNLIGGVLLFVFGLYYRMVPAARDHALAKWQGLLQFIGAILFPVGVAVVIKK